MNILVGHYICDDAGFAFDNGAFREIRKENENLFIINKQNLSMSKRGKPICSRSTSQMQKRAKQSILI